MLINAEVKQTMTEVKLPSQRNSLQNLKQLATNKDLAKYLGVTSPKLLTWLGKTKSTHYSKLFIRKKGKKSRLRVLHNPDKLMRTAQYRVYLKILSKINVPDYIYAFEKNKSIPAMAAHHVGKAIIISLDIKDFFHSIKQTQLQRLFEDIGIGDKPARTLSELCTYKAFVPQGAITSPKVSNIITAKTFGPQVKAYCDGKGLILTIYADDITVSSQDPSLNVGDVISAITNIVTENGFRVNTRKTKVMKRHHRQYVCGVVVNEKTNLIRKERLRLRAIVHNIKVYGPDHEAMKNQTTVDNFVNVLRGKLNWFKQLNNAKGEDLILKLKASLELHKVEVPETALTLVGPTLNDGEQKIDVGPLPWEVAIETVTQTPQPGV